MSHAVDYSRAVLIILILVADRNVGARLSFTAMTQVLRSLKFPSSVLVSSQESEARAVYQSRYRCQFVASSQNESLSNKNQAVQAALLNYTGLSQYSYLLLPRSDANSQGAALVSQSPIKSHSIIKLFIMQVLLEEIKAGRLSWQETTI